MNKENGGVFGNVDLSMVPRFLQGDVPRTERLANPGAFAEGSLKCSGNERFCFLVAGVEENQPVIAEEMDHEARESLSEGRAGTICLLQ